MKNLSRSTGHWWWWQQATESRTLIRPRKSRTTKQRVETSKRRTCLPKVLDRQHSWLELHHSLPWTIKTSARCCSSDNQRCRRAALPSNSKLTSLANERQLTLKDSLKKECTVISKTLWGLHHKPYLRAIYAARSVKWGQQTRSSKITF